MITTKMLRRGESLESFREGYNHSNRGINLAEPHAQVRATIFGEKVENFVMLLSI